MRIIITCSLALVRFCKLAIVLTREGCPARLAQSIVLEALKIAAARRTESFASCLRA
jgi:hypothetical protein